MQQSLPLLAIAFGSLLNIPGVDFLVFNPRLLPLAVDKGIKASRGVPIGAASLEGEIFIGLLTQCGLMGSALHRTHFGADSHRTEIVHHGLNHATIDTIDMAFPGVETVGIASLFQ